MIYKDHEIVARVYQSGSTVYDVDKNGDITDEIPELAITHDDQAIVWYEIEAIDPQTGMTTEMQPKTFADAKAAIDASIAYLKDFD